VVIVISVYEKLMIFKHVINVYEKLPSINGKFIVNGERLVELEDYYNGVTKIDKDKINVDICYR